MNPYDSTTGSANIADVEEGGNNNVQSQLIAAHQSAQLAMLMMQQQQQQQPSLGDPSSVESSFQNFLGVLSDPMGQSLDTVPQAVIPQAVMTAATKPDPTSTTANSQFCIRCGCSHCDVRILGCGCFLHARCTPVPLISCPNPRCSPNSNSSGIRSMGGGEVGKFGGGCTLELLPMAFVELDEAKRLSDIAAKASLRAKEKSNARKRKLGNVKGAPPDVVMKEGDKDPTPSSTPSSNELRTGRWTAEETIYCDKLAQKFVDGRLPLTEGIKLNEFLSDMLKSKQSRLTKKMKNAKLSSKTFKRTSGYLADAAEAREFSDYEDAFFNSLQNRLERAEMRFHIQKEWRETFSTYCVSHGQPLNVDEWLESVEEMEKRVHRAKDVERIQRRKMMLGHALRQDSQTPNSGVRISRGTGGLLDSTSINSVASSSQTTLQHHNGGTGVLGSEGSSSLSSTPFIGISHHLSSATTDLNYSSISQHESAPFLYRIIEYMNRHSVPFEYVDLWVPSNVPDPQDESSQDGLSTGGSSSVTCRLCFAGYAVAKNVVIDTVGSVAMSTSVAMSPEDNFTLATFGDYSKMFSFNVGCGIPGKVYKSNVPTWEQNVHQASKRDFERVGGGMQCGIRTLVGIPVDSPNVGRIVVIIYSRYDRIRDPDLVMRMKAMCERLMPMPTWKLVVDIGAEEVGQQMLAIQHQQYQSSSPQIDATSHSLAPNTDQLTNEVISIFAEHMPSDPMSPAFEYLQGFMALRLLLLRPLRNDSEQAIVDTILSSYSSYKSGGRSRSEIAVMLARDFMYLNPHANSQQIMSHQPQSNALSLLSSRNAAHEQYSHHAYAPAQQQVQSNQYQNLLYSLAASNMGQLFQHSQRSADDTIESSHDHLRSMDLQNEDEQQHQEQGDSNISSNPLGDQQQRDRGESNASSMLSDLRDMLEDTTAHSHSSLKASFLSATAAPDAGSSEDSIPMD